MRGRRDRRRRSPSNTNLPPSSRDFASVLACHTGIGIGAQRCRYDVSHVDLAATQTKVTVASMASATNRGAFDRSLRSKPSTPWAMDEPPDYRCVVGAVASRMAHAAVALSELTVVQGDIS